LRHGAPSSPPRHTSRFIICYLTFLPFSLWSYLEWLLLPTMVVLTFLLLGIENIGIQVCLCGWCVCVSVCVCVWWWWCVCGGGGQLRLVQCPDSSSSNSSSRAD
jgi:hypothetical protein